MTVRTPELHVYDFDGTLFNSPMPPASWRGGESWWVDSVSLSEPCVPEVPDASWWNGDVVSDARGSIADPNVLAVLCTGRSVDSFARYRVPELLAQAGLRFDHVHLKPSGDTETFKKKVILSYLTRYPDIGAVHIYEDRLNHLAAFCRMVEGVGVPCVPHPIRRRGDECSAARVASRWGHRIR